jgi:hypothetical protein
MHAIEKLELEYWNWKDKKWQRDWDSSKADGVAGKHADPGPHQGDLQERSAATSRR